MLTHAGKISHQIALDKSAKEFAKYREILKEVEKENSLKELENDIKSLNKEKNWVSMEEWKKVRWGDVVEFNPTERIPKDTICRKILMDKVIPYNRDICDYEIYSGETKIYTII